MINLDKDFNPEGKYFIFCVEDTWAIREDFNGFGFELYQLVGGKMKVKLGVDCWGTRTGDEIANFLKEKNILKVYNPLEEIAGKFEGAKSSDEPDEDGNFIERWPYTIRKGLFPYEVKESGIEMIGFD